MRNRDDVAYEFLDSLKSGSPDDFLDHLTDDVEIHICLGNQLYTDSYAGTFMGKSGAVNLFVLCGNFLKYINASPTDFHHECDKMIVRGDLKCQLTTSSIMWNSSWMQIWTFSGDRISKLRVFADYHTLPLSDIVPPKMEAGMCAPKEVAQKHSFFS